MSSSDHPPASPSPAAEALPFLLLEAAEERHRQGDYGAERMLCDWADMLRDWEW